MEPLVREYSLSGKKEQYDCHSIPLARVPRRMLGGFGQQHTDPKMQFYGLGNRLRCLGMNTNIES